jgi:5-methylcytosine-specific restriction enzyme subunit McrC
MTHLTLREHQWCPVSDAGPMTERRAALLEALAKNWPAGALEWRRHSFKFAGFCGVVRVDGLVIEVLPKITAENVPEATARGVLVNMLRATGTFPAELPGGASLHTERHHLLDTFILAFCRQVSRELVQGVIRRYRELEENLTAVRGRIDFVQQVRRNLVHQERVACRYEELSADNPYNRVLKAVLLRLARVSAALDVRRAVNELQIRLAEVTDVPVTRQDVQALTFDRSNRRWENVFRQCEWLLAGFGPSVAAGRNESVALLFDMNFLFEAWVTRQWRRWCAPLGYTLSAQDRGRCLAQDSAGKNAFPLRPDIVIRDGENKVVQILDAKWKQPGENLAGISQADVYQMTAYAQAYQCPSLGLIYPGWQDALLEIENYRLNGRDVRLALWRCPLGQGRFEYSSNPLVNTLIGSNP